MERRLDADHAVERAGGERQPDGVAVHGPGAGLREPIPAGHQLRSRDVQSDEPPRLGHAGDHGVLRGQPVADVEHIRAFREIAGERLDQPAHRDRRFGGVAPVSLPQAEVQPPGRERDEEVLADAVVDRGGRVSSVAEHRRPVPEVLAGPAGLRHGIHPTHGPK